MTADEIRALRARLGLTQVEFAHALGVTPATVSRWENGTAAPSKLALAMLRRKAEGRDDD